METFIDYLTDISIDYGKKEKLHHYNKESWIQKQLINAAVSGNTCVRINNLACDSWENWLYGWCADNKFNMHVVAKYKIGIWYYMDVEIMW